MSVEVHSVAIEGVRQLVSDDGSDGAVIDERWRLRVEQRRPQDASREFYAILGQIVASSDQSRVHVGPFVTIAKLAQTCFGCQ